MPLSIPSLLEKHGLKIEELNTAERDTLEKWSKAWQQQEMSVSKIQELLENLIDGTQKELADLKESTSFWAWLFNRKKDIFVKARLRNYLTLRDFIAGPERARKFIEENLKNINNK